MNKRHNHQHGLRIEDTLEQPALLINSKNKDPRQLSLKIRRIGAVVVPIALAGTIAMATLTRPSNEEGKANANGVELEAEPTISDSFVVKFDRYGIGGIGALNKALEDNGIDSDAFGIDSTVNLGNKIQDYFGGTPDLGDKVEVQLLDNGDIRLAEYQPPQE